MERAMKENGRIEITEQQVMEYLGANGVRTANDIAENYMEVEYNSHHHVSRAYWLTQHIKMTAFKMLLDDLVEQGKIVKFRGSEKAVLPYGANPRAWYYATTEKMAEELTEREQVVKQRLMGNARAEATEIIVGRHREEIEELTADIFAKKVKEADDR
jgi:hypothetical protein